MKNKTYTIIALKDSYQLGSTRPNGDLCTSAVWDPKVDRDKAVFIFERSDRDKTLYPVFAPRELDQTAYFSESYSEIIVKKTGEYLKFKGLDASSTAHPFKLYDISTKSDWRIGINLKRHADGHSLEGDGFIPSINGVSLSQSITVCSRYDYLNTSHIFIGIQLNEDEQVIKVFPFIGLQRSDNAVFRYYRLASYRQKDGKLEFFNIAPYPSGYAAGKWIL